MPPSNQLVLPPKVTPAISFAASIQQYIHDNVPDAHEDAFRTDIERLDRLRSQALDGIAQRSSSKVEALTSYLLHLLQLIKRLPPSLPPPIPYSPPVPPSSFSLSLPPPPAVNHFQWEICNVMFNLAAAWSARAGEEERRTAEAIGRAKRALESSAGVLHTLRLVQLPLLRTALGQNATDEVPPDLSEPWLDVAERLLLAQAQECFWQAGVAGGNLKNPTIAKLAESVAQLYDSTYELLSTSPSIVRDALPVAWLSHIDTKRNHFHAAAQFRQSSADGDAHKYGEELARLYLATDFVKKGLEATRRGVSVPVGNDIKSLSKAINDTVVRAERDNDLIYHQDVPATSTLPPIQPRNVVNPTPVPGLSDPRKTLGNDLLFDKLLPWPVTRALYIYEERKKDWLQEEICAKDEELEQSASRVLQELNLPAAIDALERPVGLPPSLLGKAEEVGQAGGVKRVQALFSDVAKLSANNTRILDDAYDILDLEASEDESIRAAHPQWHRLPSQEANAALIEQAQRYSKLMEQAAVSDKQVRDKWEEWEDTVDKLAQGQDELEAFVPSLAFQSFGTESGNNPSVSHSRKLRALLESLDDLKEDRKRIVARVKHALSSDDIKPEVLREAETIGLDELKPELFEDSIQASLEKFSVYKERLEEQAEQQEALLEEIREEDALFEELTRNDPSVREREQALQELELGYHRYSEVVLNLNEGINFYNGMARYLNDLRENCKAWSRDRRAEAQNWSSRAQPSTSNSSSAAAASPSNYRQVQPSRPQRFAGEAHPPPPRGYGLPPPDSQEWEEAPPLVHPSQSNFNRPPDPGALLPPPDSTAWEELPLPPPPPPSSRSQSTRGSGKATKKTR